MSSRLMGTSTSTSSPSLLAEQLQEDILGPSKHALACGCILGVLAKLPGTSGYVNLLEHGHEYCEEHVHQYNFLSNFYGPNSWMHWYTGDPQKPGPVTQQEFQAAFDELSLVDAGSHPPFGKPLLSVHLTETIKDWVKAHPSDRWVLSKGWTRKIYRTGAVAQATEMDLLTGIPFIGTIRKI